MCDLIDHPLDQYRVLHPLSQGDLAEGSCEGRDLPLAPRRTEGGTAGVHRTPPGCLAPQNAPPGLFQALLARPIYDRFSQGRHHL